MQGLDPVHTGTQSFHFVPYCSEKWNAEGLRSDGNTSNKTIPFQKVERLKKVIRRMERYAIVLFRSNLKRQMESMSPERLRSRLKTKQNWYAIVPFPCEQPICPFQKLERRWNGRIAFPCELDCHLRFQSQSCQLFLWGRTRA